MNDIIQILFVCAQVILIGPLTYIATALLGYTCELMGWLPKATVESDKK